MESFFSSELFDRLDSQISCALQTSTYLALKIHKLYFVYIKRICLLNMTINNYSCALHTEHTEWLPSIQHNKHKCRQNFSHAGFISVNTGLLNNVVRRNQRQYEYLFTPFLPPPTRALLQYLTFFLRFLSTFRLRRRRFRLSTTFSRHIYCHSAVFTFFFLNICKSIT